MNKVLAFVEKADKVIDVAGKAVDVYDKALDTADKQVKVIDRSIPVIEKGANMVLNVAERAVDAGANIIDKIVDIPFRIINKFNKGGSTSDNIKSELNIAINTIKDVEIKQNICAGNIGKLGGIVHNHDFRIGRLEGTVVQHGMRIGRLEGIVSQHGIRLNRLEGTVDLHSRQIAHMSNQINRHENILNQHGKQLNEHSQILNRHSEQINIISNQVNQNTQAINYLSVKPVFSLNAIVSMGFIAILSIIDHVVDIQTIGALTENDYAKDPSYKKTIFGEGISNFISAIFLSPPKNITDESISVLILSKFYDPSLIKISSIILIILSFCGKLMGFLQTIPHEVIGAIAIILAGATICLGIEMFIKNKVNFADERNIIILSVTFVLGIAIDHLNFFGISLSGISIAMITNVILNSLMSEK